jgi:hypothetical protein
MKSKTEKEQDISGAEVLMVGENNSRLRERHEQMWTLEEAFDGDRGPKGSIPAETGIINDTSREELNLERGIRSVTFLLDYVSEDGNTTIDGYVAQGLMKCLRFCASEASRLQKWHND